MIFELSREERKLTESSPSGPRAAPLVAAVRFFAGSNPDFFTGTRVEAEAKKSEPFRRSMANMNVWGAHRDAVAARVEAAAGVRLPRPRNWNGP